MDRPPAAATGSGSSSSSSASRRLRLHRHSQRPHGQKKQRRAAHNSGTAPPLLAVLLLLGSSSASFSLAVSNGADAAGQGGAASSMRSSANSSSSSAAQHQHAPGDASGGKAAQIMSCLPSSCTTQRTVWDHMLHHVPPCIAAKRVWWSAHAPRLPVTLVTQLSANRLPALRAQCQAWAGPLAAVVFVPLFNPGPEGARQLSMQCQQRLQAAIHAVQEVFQWAEEQAAATRANAVRLAAGATRQEFLGAEHTRNATSHARASCQLRVLLLYELYQQEKATALYPVNSLRNYARLLADTPLIANIDVDMLPSLSLSQALIQGWGPATTVAEALGSGGGGSSVAAAAAGAAGGEAPKPGSAADLLRRAAREKAVFVLPALETKCGGPALADQVTAYSKDELRDIMAANCTMIFRYEKAPQCHNATNFPRWMELPTEPTDGAAPYRVTYEDSFEPWFIGARDQTEWFDVRYRGYGKNKIQQVAHTAHRAAVFYVHPTGFIVHRPHDQSDARKTFLRVKFKSRQNAQLLQNSLYQHVEDMWERHSQEIKAGQFQALIDDTLAKCLQTLPWWQSVYSR